MSNTLTQSNTPEIKDLAQYTQTLAEQAKDASCELRVASGEQKTKWIRETIKRLKSQESEILEANQLDLNAAESNGISGAAFDRLKLTPERLDGIAQALEEIIMLPEPIGEILESNVRPNGLLITKVRVSLGVVFFIYESRPNVTIDAAALCVKSGNAVILRGGKEAFHSNMILQRLLKDALKTVGLPENAVQYVETTNRDAVGHFLKMDQYINVTIPRGGKSLIERVANEATMPVIKHYDGICHVYVHEEADPGLAVAIAVNSKTHRTGVCNAAECLLIDESVAEKLLPTIASALLEKDVELFGCPRTCDLVPEAQPATDENYHTEYLGLKMSVKVVANLQDAMAHIEKYSSQHTETIITNDLKASTTFTTSVDSSAVMVNASTRFNDGGEFGLGAEIGISTDKFHARGPCGLKELTSYKYVVHGDGQIR